MGKKLGSSITGVNDALRLCVGDPSDAALVSTSPNPADVVPVGEKRHVKKKSAFARKPRLSALISLKHVIF